jgi:hypothetical protein
LTVIITKKTAVEAAWAAANRQYLSAWPWGETLSPEAFITARLLCARQLVSSGEAAEPCGFDPRYSGVLKKTGGGKKDGNHPPRFCSQ